MAGGSIVKEMTTNFGKLDKFEGHDFRRWQKKMHFLLTTLKVVYVLPTLMPELLEDATVEAIRRRAKWDNDDYICRGHILNDKLPRSWKDFKHTLKHGKHDLSLVQLGSHLHIEESLRAQKSDNGKGKKVDGPSKPKLAWWNCGKTGHFKKDCRSGNKKDNSSASGSGKGSKDQSQNQGIIHETTDPYTPQQNGVAEGKIELLKKWAVVRLPDPKRKSLGEKGIDCIFVGYVEHSKAYRFYVIEPNDSISINTIIESRDAILHENHFSSIPRPKDIIPNLDESQRGDHSNDVPSETLEPRKGKRARKAKSYGSDFQLYLVEGSRDQIGSQYSYCYSIEKDPRTYNEAMQSRDVAFWKQAIDDEIGCKWIFKRKMKVDGIIDKFKARLVIQGFRQKEGIDYFDTYAPVARNEHKVRKLVKSLYGLKQAPKQWHQKFDEVVLSSGFLLDQSNKCVYRKFDGSCKGVIICLYVDDILIFGTDQTKKFLSSKFSMKDVGEANVILGIEIKRENKGIVITQSHYIKIILKKFNRGDCSPVSTPMDPVEKLMQNTGKPMDQLEHSRAIGCLMYAMKSTRPDIAYAVDRLSKFTSNPNSFSTSGWVFLLGGGTISWASKKQTCITSYIMESKFVALVATEAEFNVKSSELEIRAHVFIFSRCKTACNSIKYEQTSNSVSLDFMDNHARDCFKKHEGLDTWFSIVQPWKNDFRVDECVLWVDVEGITLVAWTNKTFMQVAKIWGELSFSEGSDDNNLWRKRLCVVTKVEDFIMGSFKIIIKGKMMKVKSQYPAEDNVASGKDGGHVNNFGKVHETFSNTKQTSKQVEKEQQSQCNTNSVKGERGSDKDPVLPKGKCPRTDSSLLKKMNEFVEIGQTLGFSMEGCINNIEKLISRQGDGGLEYGRYSLEYGVLPSSGYGVLDLVSFMVFGEGRHIYVVSSLMDTTYWSSEQ
ncbi:zinc finger, CCHC-type containing protein [Tanacetum coccineum]